MRLVKVFSFAIVLAGVSFTTVNHDNKESSKISIKAYLGEEANAGGVGGHQSCCFQNKYGDYVCTANGPCK